VSVRVFSCRVGLISFAASAPNSQQPSYDDLRSPSGNCFTSAKRRQLHSFVTTLNKHVPAKRCSCLVCVRPRLNLISNHRRRSGPTGSVAQREFLSCLIQCCSAATSTLKGVGAHWQSDENATMDPSMSHQDAIDVALIDALHAISNETSKAGTHPSQSTHEACEGSFTRNSGRPLDSMHVRESLTVLLLLAFFFSLFACLFTSKIAHSPRLSAYSIFCRSCPSDRPCLFCISLPTIIPSYPCGFSPA
jgi:hypothetical protein